MISLDLISVLFSWVMIDGDMEMSRQRAQEIIYQLGLHNTSSICGTKIKNFLGSFVFEDKEVVVYYNDNIKSVEYIIKRCEQ